MLLTELQYEGWWCQARRCHGASASPGSSNTSLSLSLSKAAHRPRCPRPERPATGKRVHAHAAQPAAASTRYPLRQNGNGERGMGTLLKALGGAIGIIFLIGLVVVVGIVALIF